MLYLNDAEERVIGPFMDIEEKFSNKTLRLVWSNGSEVVAKYDSFIEDENEEDYNTNKYEEYWSFVFVAIDISLRAPIDLSADNLFTINYHNFPEKILYEDEIIYKRI